MNRHRDLCYRSGKRIKNFDGTSIEKPKPKPAEAPAKKVSKKKWSSKK